MSTDNLQRAQAWLSQVLALMGIPVGVEVVGGRLLLDGLPPSHHSLFVQPLPGEEGITLDALQYLANTLLNLHRPESEQQSYELDLGGYRARRWADLQAAVLAAVEQVRQGGGEFVWEGLSAAERRQIHTFLQDPAYADVETLSRGKEPQRHLVIRQR
ncbi:MAG: R3H domain-containing nucleic acid-binding protein [Thermostichales cyanobacterium BF4_bins_65]